MRLTTSGIPRNFSTGIVGRIVDSDIAAELRRDAIRLVRRGENAAILDLEGYSAILSHDACSTTRPVVDMLRDSDHFTAGDVVVLEGATGFVRSLYRPYERHHSLFITERCSSNCLMCSQPPKDKDDTAALTARNRELIRLMQPAPSYLTITGGEPTLAGDGLFTLLEDLRIGLPETELHMLTNGRTFAWPAYTRRFAEVDHPNICLGIPLYSDDAGTHDYIVQAKDAFSQTIAGMHLLAAHDVRVEVRVVLHRLTVPRLLKLADYIYRNLSFVEHVALMGLEYVGYAPRNIDELWIDPFEYKDELDRAVQFLSLRGIPVSVYNHQLCTINKASWPFAQKSISDWKNAYLPQCEKCSVLDDCGGIFQWAAKKHSKHIRPFPVRSEAPMSVQSTIAHASNALERSR